MQEIADTVSRSFAFLDDASGGGVRFCEISIGLVGYETGVQTKDFQSLKRECARLKMIGRWDDEQPPGQREAAIQSLLRNTAHEAYHIALRRNGPPNRSRIAEEIEASIVERCAARAILDASAAPTPSEERLRLADQDVSPHYHESLAGDLAATGAIRSGRVADIAAAAPDGTAKSLLTACAPILQADA